MSGYVDEAATIRAWFAADWESGVPIHLIENSEFKDKPDNAPYAKLFIRPRDAFTAGVGGPQVRYRHPGDIILEIRVPEGVGDGRARELADAGCDIIRGREEGMLRVWSARAIALGVRDGWCRFNVLGSYSWDGDFTVHE